jgi:hypothetical protein
VPLAVLGYRHAEIVETCTHSAEVVQLITYGKAHSSTSEKRRFVLLLLLLFCRVCRVCLASWWALLWA